MRGEALLRRRVAADHQQLKLGAGRHVQLGARRADVGDQLHQPSDLGIGGSVDRRRHGPRLADQRAVLGTMASLVPDLLGDERHHRMEQLSRLAQHEGRDGARLILLGTVGALQSGFAELDVPVADDAPDKFVERRRRVVQAILCQRMVDGVVGTCQLSKYPLVDGKLRARRIETLRQHSAIHLREAGRVPELGGEVARSLDPGRRQAQTAGRGRRHRRHREAQRVGTVFVDQLQRVDDVALGLGHLLTLLVRHQPVQVDGAERHLGHEMHAHHHHAGDPEEQDVPAGDECVGRIVFLERRRLLGPAESREWPQGRTEPGVEHVGID